MSGLIRFQTPGAVTGAMNLGLTAMAERTTKRKMKKTRKMKTTSRVPMDRPFRIGGRCPWSSNGAVSRRPLSSLAFSATILAQASSAFDCTAFDSAWSRWQVGQSAFWFMLNSGRARNIMAGRHPTGKRLLSRSIHKIPMLLVRHAKDGCPYRKADFRRKRDIDGQQAG